MSTPLHMAPVIKGLQQVCFQSPCISRFVKDDEGCDEECPRIYDHDNGSLLSGTFDCIKSIVWSR